MDVFQFNFNLLPWKAHTKQSWERSSAIYFLPIIKTFSLILLYFLIKEKNKKTNQC